MTLEEQLARRLKAAADSYWGSLGNQRHPWEAISPHAQEEYLAMAREALRVAEWARNNAEPVGLDGWRLTLPDEGWKP